MIELEIKNVFLFVQKSDNRWIKPKATRCRHSIIKNKPSRLKSSEKKNEKISAVGNCHPKKTADKLKFDKFFDIRESPKKLINYEFALIVHKVVQRSYKKLTNLISIFFSFFWIDRNKNTQCAVTKRTAWFFARRKRKKKEKHFLVTISQVRVIRYFPSSQCLTSKVKKYHFISIEFFKILLARYILQLFFHSSN